MTLTSITRGLMKLAHYVRYWGHSEVAPCRSSTVVRTNQKAYSGRAYDSKTDNCGKHWPWSRADRKQEQMNKEKIMITVMIMIMTKRTPVPCM